MKFDPAARAGAKLQLNSLWGKWAHSDFELRLINAETGMVKGKMVKALQRPNTKGNSSRNFYYLLGSSTSL